MTELQITKLLQLGYRFSPASYKTMDSYFSWDTATNWVKYHGFPTPYERPAGSGVIMNLAYNTAAHPYQAPK